MPKLKVGREPARKPTPFPDLNAVLAVLVEGVKARLGDNLIGAYLQGSFAVGDADEVSDCDFIVVVRRDLTDAEISSLNEMHAAIHDLPYLPWRHRLEGSYVPADIIRRWSLTPRDPPGEPRPSDWADPGLSGSPPRAYPFVYLDHGGRSVARSEHDNTQVVRWQLREKGVVLFGPDPKTLVDPVPAAALRAEVRETMDRCIAVGLQPMEAMAIWQAFWVGLFCRILHTLATGAVASKKAGALWAMAALDPRWRELIARALARRRPGGGHAARRSCGRCGDPRLRALCDRLYRPRGELVSFWRGRRR
jgi:predicted nucleotidyltransferase